MSKAVLKVPVAGEALASLARRTDDPTRDLPPATREAGRRKLETLPHAGRLLIRLEGIADRDSAEALRGGLFIVDSAELPPIDDPDPMPEAAGDGVPISIV